MCSWPMYGTFLWELQKVVACMHLIHNVYHYIIPHQLGMYNVGEEKNKTKSFTI